MLLATVRLNQIHFLALLTDEVRCYFNPSKSIPAPVEGRSLMSRDCELLSRFLLKIVLFFLLALLGSFLAVKLVTFDLGSIAISLFEPMSF